MSHSDFYAVVGYPTNNTARLNHDFRAKTTHLWFCAESDDLDLAFTAPRGPLKRSLSLLTAISRRDVFPSFSRHFKPHS